MIPIDEAPQRLFRFPPFLSPPPGVTIIPFKDFRPSGIQIQINPSGDTPELDGVGIPTIELRVKHNTDESKSSSKRKKKKKKAEEARLVTNGTLERKKTWYELWEDAEDLRGLRDKLDAGTPAIDRLIQAAEDFRTGRSWPPPTIGISQLWDMFRLYIGLLSNQPVLRSAKNARASSPDDDCFSDDEDSNPKEVPKETEKPAHNIVEDDDGIDDREVKLQKFLDDPELSMNIFFSWHMREKGLIWAERNLSYMPRLVLFFLNFIIRNNAIPEYNSALRCGLMAAERAARELPLTGKLGQMLPDPLSVAFKETWVSHGEIVLAWGSRNDEGEPSEPDEDEQQKKKRKTAPEEEPEFKDEIEAALISPDHDVGLGAHREMAADADMEDGWGAGVAPEWSADDVGGLNTWEQQPATDGWFLPVTSLIDMLGPTALPLTHQPGLVECSVRKIKTVFLPVSAKVSDSGKEDRQVDVGTTKPWSGEEGPNAVEQGLVSKFARVVLEPWPNWDKEESSDISKPIMLPSSRPTRTSSHNPLSDDIVVLMEPDRARLCLDGMGLGLSATWVEIAQNEDNGKFWYMKELRAIFPSFYIQPDLQAPSEE